MANMGDNREITRLLSQWSEGQREAFHALAPLVYEELKRLADHYLRNERRGHTLQPTALVHEAFLRLAGLQAMRLNNRSHFYGAAAQVMRRVLVDHARQRQALKRAVPEEGLSKDPLAGRAVDMRLDLLALDVALDRLAAIAPLRARVVELRYFGGLSIEETAEYLSIGTATVKRHWAFARAWLYRAIDSGWPATSSPR
jgi:RNA polymerase sigma factor (TIGR02999 family)